MAQLNEWLTIDKTSGTGNAEITLTASSYEELVERTAAIRVQGKSTVSLLTVKQSALVPTITFSKNALYFPYDGQYTSITLTSNVEWQTRKSDSWIYVSHDYGNKGETTFGVEVFENTGETQMGKIEFLFNGEVIATLNIIQYGLQSFEKDVMSFGYLAETQQNKVLNKGDWYIVTEGDWYSVTPTRGSGVSNFSVHVENNNEGRRIGKISLYATDGDFFLGEISVRQASEYDDEYLWIECLEDDSYVSTRGNVVYSFDGSIWETGSHIQMGTNRLVYMYSPNGKDTPSQTYEISCDRNFSVGGKATCLGTDLSYVFREEDKLIDASELDISELYDGYSMFRECVNLKYPPKTLPSDGLGNYAYMFHGCTSLLEAPALPALTLPSYNYYHSAGVYERMFRGCTSLTTPPALPATSLGAFCYAYMFYGCTSLVSTPTLPSTYMKQGCYTGMFMDCTSITNAPALPATDLSYYIGIGTTPSGCYEVMFEGCTSLITAPELPATILNERCYMTMFKRCTSLTSAPALPATTLKPWCYSAMFKECTNITTAPVLPATTLQPWCYEQMFYSCRKLNYIKMLATDISADRCLDNWVYNVSQTGTFVKHPNADIPIANMWDTVVVGIPNGWTVETATS